MAGDYGAYHFCTEDIVRWNGREIAIEHDEVGDHAGCQRSFVTLTELCVS
jgi:hypothetical protein